VLCLFTYGGVRHMLCCVCLRMVVSNTCCVVFLYVWWCPTHVVLCLLTHHMWNTTNGKQTQHNMCRTPPYVNKHNKTCVDYHPLVVFDTCCIVFVYIWWCSTHVVLCLFTIGGVQHMLCCVCLRMVVSNTCCVVFVYPYGNKHNTCVEHHQW
jgi:hypothetical protein